MAEINPFTGSILQSTVIQPRQLQQRNTQLRRAQNLARDSALQGDQLDHQVESTEATSPTGDQPDKNPRDRRQQQQAPPPAPDPEAPPHLDLTA